MRRTRLTGLGTIAVVVALAVAAPAAFADREFEKRFSDNKPGDIAMAANVLTTCRPATNNNCVRDRAGTSGNNNSYFTDFVDVDNDASTFNSSEAQLSLPADATVLFAGLYWGANTTTKEGRDGENPARDAGAKNRVKFATPASGGYVDVQATVVDDAEAGSQLGAYQAFLNVTNRVQAGKSGTYRVANVQAGTGKDRYAGWSLVVAYRSDSALPRNLTVFDGFETINTGAQRHGKVVRADHQPRPVARHQPHDPRHAPGWRALPPRHGRRTLQRQAARRDVPPRELAHWTLRRTQIHARLGSGGRAATLRNSILADAAQRDPAAANNRDRARSALAPRVTLSKAVNARTAERGDTLTYTLRLRNRGPGTARNVVLCDRPGSGLMLRRAPRARVRRGAACWTIRRITRGSSVSRRVVATVTSRSRPRLSNVATVRVQGTRVARASRTVRVVVGRPPGVTG